MSYKNLFMDRIMNSRYHIPHGPNGMTLPLPRVLGVLGSWGLGTGKLRDLKAVEQTPPKCPFFILHTPSSSQSKSFELLKKQLTSKSSLPSSIPPSSSPTATSVPKWQLSCEASRRACRMTYQRASDLNSSCPTIRLAMASTLRSGNTPT